MTVDQWLKHATETLGQACIGSARLDSLLLLSDELGVDKAWLLAHGQTELATTHIARLTPLLARRESREPIAYIRGTQEFYGRNFSVTPDVLIPRPETEAIIETFAELPVATSSTVIDVGTGSGAIAITIKLQHPRLRVIATDISQAALDVAAANAGRLEADIELRQGSLLAPMLDQPQLAPMPPEQHLRSPQTEPLLAARAVVKGASVPVEVIIANLPYVDRSWARSPETDYEPPLALFAKDGGLALITKLLHQASSHVATNGYLLLEADPEQHDAISELAANRGFRHIDTKDYCLSFQKKPGAAK